MNNETRVDAEPGCHGRGCVQSPHERVCRPSLYSSRPAAVARSGPSRTRAMVLRSGSRELPKLYRRPRVLPRVCLPEPRRVRAHLRETDLVRTGDSVPAVRNVRMGLIRGTRVLCDVVQPRSGRRGSCSRLRIISLVVHRANRPRLAVSTWHGVQRRRAGQLLSLPRICGGLRLARTLSVDFA